MSKNIILGVAGFGGLVLVASLFFGNDEEAVINKERVEVAAVEIPNDIPAFPIYTNSTVVSVTDTDSESARDISLSLAAEASINDVNEWYRQQLSSGGWSIKSDKNVGGYQIIQGEKDNLYTSEQTANAGDAGYVTISQHLKIRK